MSSLRRRAAALVCFVSLAAGLWLWLDHLGDQVDWIIVEGPAHVVVGEPVRLQVHATRLAADTLLRVDLHWATERNNSLGFLAAGEPRTETKFADTIDFNIAVPARENLRFVHGVIYLSPDGNWSNHTFAATTDLIPVALLRSDQSPELIRWPLRQLAEGSGRMNQPQSPLLRWATGVTWLVAAVWLGRQWQSARRSVKKPIELPRRQLLLAMSFALAGIWELAGLEIILGDQARSFARAEDLYYPRAIFQKGVISMMIAATLVWFGLRWRQRAARPWLLGFGLYLAVTLVDLLSYHAVDEFTGRSWHGVTLMAAIKLLCALTAVIRLLRIQNQSASV